MDFFTEIWLKGSMLFLLRGALSLFFICLSFSLSAKDEISDDLVFIPTGGVPGQILEEGPAKKIYFENGVFVEWSGQNLVLKDANAKAVLAVNLSSGVEKTSAREALGDQVMEQDLGGTLKKKAPLAYKNPVFRDIKVLRGSDDPLKSSGIQASQVNEKTTPEGGKEVITDYSDGSKGVVYTYAGLKEESSYNKKGDVVWMNLEGQDKGFKFKKTQWQDGSLIREFSTSDGILSVVYDVDGSTQTFSFLKKLVLPCQFAQEFPRSSFSP